MRSRIEQMLRLALTMVLALILSLAGIPANALAEEIVDADAEEFATKAKNSLKSLLFRFTGLMIPS